MEREWGSDCPPKKHQKKYCNERLCYADCSSLNCCSILKFVGQSKLCFETGSAEALKIRGSNILKPQNLGVGCNVVEFAAFSCLG